ncbi:6699_t:CDS:2 [Paraglomus brasilianum]|uniref:6699_t:CDS:1 n=1 Tax=Paraglomus brasilianum TaxID=144538 RepID=A0A9N8Z4J0_9GLOM|nr:6699_t:CDS:2 [Paraglomus brasilianum]
MPAAETLEGSFSMDEQDLPADATSFFPLLLQAQDLISKLESRVLELENDLETINESHEQERDQLLQDIGERDEHIHGLKTKMSRLEFGAREAIVVLARTVDTLKAQAIEDDDNDSKDDDDATAVESTDLEGQFLDSIKLCLNYLKNAQNNNKVPQSNKSKRYQEKIIHNEIERKKSLTPPTTARRDSRTEVDETPNDDDNDHNTSDESRDQVRNLQPSYNNNSRDSESALRSRAQSFSSHITLDDISLDGYELSGDEDIAGFNLSDDEDNHEYVSQEANKPLDLRIDVPHRHDTAETVTPSVDDNDHNVISSNTCGSHAIIEEPEEIVDIDDLEEIVASDDERDHEESDEDESEFTGLRPLEPIPDIATSSSCPNCATLLAQLDQHIEERAYLKRDLAAMATDLAEEQNLRTQIQSSKESLEQEIDDWINAMFEKVNQMVYDEANAREDLEILNREFKGRLEQPLKSSHSREDRLREMKLLLVHFDSTKQRQAAPTPTGANLYSRNSIVRRNLMTSSPFNSPRASRNFGHMSPSLFSASMEEFMFAKSKKVYVDGLYFEEFQEYVKSFGHNPSSKDLNLNSPFMKRCMQEDIQPCLFEGKSGWKSPFYKRRLLEAIMKNQCEIQPINYSAANSVPSTPTTSQNSIPSPRTGFHEPPASPKVKCGLCGQLRSCEFRMRLSGPDAAVPPTTTALASSSNVSARFSISGRPTWMPLDRFCRDKMVAVCDFYAYISHLRQGLLANSPIWGMYKHCLKIRRKIGLARVGSISMREEDEVNDLDNSELEGMVMLVH